MAKHTKKLLVYLDQNFLSEMSKAATNKKIEPQYSEVFGLLHQGFIDEKLVVPNSYLHDIESSMATHLREQITSCQGRLGQVCLRRPVLRQRVIQQHITFETQLKTEQEELQRGYLKMVWRFHGSSLPKTLSQIEEFAASAAFTRVPSVSIEARLFAAILVWNTTRKITPSDTADIEMLSSYVPYMDIVCTDTFMATLLKQLGIDKEFGVKLFHGKTKSLDELKQYLNDFVQSAVPTRRPSITAFVAPPRNLREQSRAFHIQLGAALRTMGMNRYAEIYAFDDGNMPRYEYSQASGVPAPFYGLQDVTAIKVPEGLSEEQILKICRERCRSDSFILIDEYKDIPETFLLGAEMSAESNRESAHGYRIYKTVPGS